MYNMLFQDSKLQASTLETSNRGLLLLSFVVVVVIIVVVVVVVVVVVAVAVAVAVAGVVVGVSHWRKTAWERRGH
eukprot:6326068-Amphidinium_carterae.1